MSLFVHNRLIAAPEGSSGTEGRCGLLYKLQLLVELTLHGAALEEALVGVVSVETTARGSLLAPVLTVTPL